MFCTTRHLRSASASEGLGSRYAAVRSALGLASGVPVGQPTAAAISDQFVASALIPSPPDDVANGANATLRSRQVARL